MHGGAPKVPCDLAREVSEMCAFGPPSDVDGGEVVVGCLLCDAGDFLGGPLDARDGERPVDDVGGFEGDRWCCV